MPLHEMEATLNFSRTWDNPLLFGEVVLVVAKGLLDAKMTDSQAKAFGWASEAVARDRAIDMLRLLDEYAERHLAAHRETLDT